VAAFTDNKGRAWDLSLSVDAVKRVRARCDGVDLLAKNLPAVLEKVLGDYVTLGDVLFLIVEPQAKVASPVVSSEDFGRALAGDAIEAASLALLDSLRDFTPNPRDRARVGKLLDTVKAAAETYRDKADEAVERGTTELLMSLRTSEPFSSSPESPASTPAT